jgi:hypothetical protein
MVLAMLWYCVCVCAGSLKRSQFFAQPRDRKTEMFTKQNSLMFGATWQWVRGNSTELRSIMKSVLNLLTFQIRGQQRIEKSVNPSFS